MVSSVVVIITLGVYGCGKSDAEKKVAEATRSVECDNRKATVVKKVVWTLEIQHLGKDAFEGTKKLSDDEFKVALEKEIIPAYLEDKDDEKNTKIAKALWKAKSVFENIKSKQIPYASIPGARTDNSEQQDAIWKIGKEICMSL